MFFFFFFRLREMTHSQICTKVIFPTMTLRREYITTRIPGRPAIPLYIEAYIYIINLQMYYIRMYIMVNIFYIDFNDKISLYIYLLFKQFLD